MKCTKCGSENVSVQIVAERKKRGCFVIMFYIILAVTLIGWLVLIPLLIGRRTVKKTYAVCQNCGNRWLV